MASEPGVNSLSSDGTLANTTDGRSVKPERSMKEQRAHSDREWYSTRGSGALGDAGGDDGCTARTVEEDDEDDLGDVSRA